MRNAPLRRHGSGLRPLRVALCVRLCFALEKPVSNPLAEKTPVQAMRIEAARRFLEHAEAELIAAGEGLAAMKVGAVARGLR